jgi:hypothetical protein
MSMRLVNNGEELLNQYSTTLGSRIVGIAERLITEMEKAMGNITCPSLVTLCAAANEASERILAQPDQTQYPTEEKLNMFFIVGRVWVHSEEFAFWSQTYQQIAIYDNEATLLVSDT